MVVKDLRSMIRAVGEESLRAVGEAFGMSLESAIRDAITSINRQMTNPESPTGYFPSRVSLPLRTAEDFWAFREQDSADMLAFAADLVGCAERCGILRGFPIRTDNIVTRLRDSGMPVEESSIEGVVRSIPIVHRSDSAFGAVALPYSKDLPIPHVRHFYATERPLQMIAVALVGATMVLAQSEGRYDFVRLARPDHGRILDPDSNLQRTLSYLIERIKANESAVYDASKVPAEQLVTANAPIPVRKIAAAVSMGAKQVLWLHELGHFLLGHLDREGDRLTDEQEADSFAVKCMLAANECGDDPQRAAKLLAGAQITFAVLSVVVPGNQKDYPSAHDRLLGAFNASETFAEESAIFQYVLWPLQVARFRALGAPREAVNPHTERLMKQLDALNYFAD